MFKNKIRFWSVLADFLLDLQPIPCSLITRRTDEKSLKQSWLPPFAHPPSWQQYQSFFLIFFISWFSRIITILSVCCLKKEIERKKTSENLRLGMYCPLKKSFSLTVRVFSADGRVNGVEMHFFCPHIYRDSTCTFEPFLAESRVKQWRVS